MDGCQSKNLWNTWKPYGTPEGQATGVVWPVRYPGIGGLSALHSKHLMPGRVLHCLPRFTANNKVPSKSPLRMASTGIFNPSTADIRILPWLFLPVVDLLLT